MPHIHHIATGGTIAFDGARMLDAESMMRHLNIDLKNTRWSHEEAERTPSSCMTPARFAQLSDRILAASADRKPDAILVTHGTDTMEESAFVADMFPPSGTPVVFTGAMRPGPSGDGPDNIRAAVRAGLELSSTARGVAVVMDRTIHAAMEVRKLHSTADDAFYSREPLGRIETNTIHWRDRLPRRIRVPLAEPRHAVHVVRLVAGDSGDQIREAAERGADGIVAEVFGAGNGPPDIFDAIEAAARDGVAVCVTTRCGDGDIRLARTCESAIVLPHLDAPKARLALLFALASERLDMLKAWADRRNGDLP